MYSPLIFINGVMLTGAQPESGHKKTALRR